MTAVHDTQNTEIGRQCRLSFSMTNMHTELDMCKPKLSTVQHWHDCDGKVHGNNKVTISPFCDRCVQDSVQPLPPCPANSSPSSPVNQTFTLKHISHNTCPHQLLIKVKSRLMSPDKHHCSTSGNNPKVREQTDSPQLNDTPVASTKFT